MEDEESLESSALVSQLPDPVQDEIDDLLSDGVVATGVVVGSIFLSGNQLFGVEQLTVGSGTDLIWKAKQVKHKMCKNDKTARKLPIVFFTSVFTGRETQKSGLVLVSSQIANHHWLLNRGLV